jgi:hypothetical protein
VSHTTAIDNIVFQDIAALTAAVNELAAQGIKCSLEKDAVPRAYYQNQVGMEKAPYVLRLHDAPFDIGFYYDKDKGGHVARTDLHAGHVSRQLGVQAQGSETAMQAALGKLNQTYAIHATTRAAVAKGMQVRRVNGNDGSVRLVVTGM